jgi:hypothetical protein
MTNVNKVMTAVSKEFTRRFLKKCPLPNLVNRQYDKRYEAYGAAAGESIEIKKTQRAEVYETQTMVPKNHEEQTTILTKSYWAGSPLSFSASELTDDLLNPNNMMHFGKDKLDAAVDAISANVHNRFSQFMFQNTYNNVGSPGTAIANHQVITEAQARLDDYSVSQSDRYVVLKPTEMASLSYGVAGLQNPANDISKTYIDGYVNRISNFDFYSTPLLKTHTRGTATNSTPIVVSVNAAGTEITVSGAGNAVTYKKGDKIKVADTYAVHPLTKDNMSFLQQFTLTADATSSAGGAVVLPIFPAIKTSGPYKTVDAITAGKAITIVGTASTTYLQGIAFQKNAFVFATQRIADYGVTYESNYSEDGLNFHLAMGGDITNAVATSRIDLKFGMATLDDWASCLIWGDDVV